MSEGVNGKIYGFYISGHSGRLIDFLNSASIDILARVGVVVSDIEIDQDTAGALNHHRITYVVYEYGRLPGNTARERNRMLSDRMLQTYQQYHVNYVFSFGSHLLSGELLERYRYHLINFHPALLPMFPGQMAIDQAANSDKNLLLIGNTAHFIDDGMDTGGIIMQSVIPLESFLEKRDYTVILKLQNEMLLTLIAVIDQGRLQMRNGRPHIADADYNAYKIYPDVRI